MPNLSENLQSIRDGILAVTLEWAKLENSMAVLLERIINNDKVFFGSAIYYAPGNSETRFDIVSRAMQALLITRDPSDDRAAMLEEWHAFAASLHRSRKARNKVAHGNITQYHREAKTHARLTPPVFHLMRMVSRPDNHQLPGMSATDVHNAARKIHELVERAHLLCHAIDALYADDASTLREKLRELAARRRAGPQSKPLPSGPTRPTP